MAAVGNMTTEAEIDQKTGAGVAVGFTLAMKTASAIQAEGTINVATRHNFSDVTLNVDVAGILSDIVSSLVAIEGVAYDFTGYNSRIEAEDKINVLRDAALRGLSLIRDKKQQDFMIGA